MTTTSTIAIAAAALLAGFAAGQAASPVAAQTPSPKPAFLIASTRTTAPEKMAPYREKAVPLARAAGLEVLASGTPAGSPALRVLEGQWTFAGGLTVERYRSMDDLMSFWNSPAYREAATLRHAASETNFIIALEGR